MDKISLMNTYYLSEFGVEQLLERVDFISSLQDELLQHELISNSLNKNSIYRILSRCVRIICDALQSAHLDLGIFLREESDLYFWINNPLEIEKISLPMEIQVDWFLYLKQIFTLSLNNPEIKIEDLIPEVISRVPALSTSLTNENRISLTQFREYIKSLRIKGRTIKGRKSKLLELVQCGHGELFSRISVAKDRDVVDTLMGAQDMIITYSSCAPLSFEGLLTMVDYHDTNPSRGLHKDDILTKSQGLDKSWRRKRMSLITYAILNLNPSSFMSSWGVLNFLKLEHDQKTSDFVIRQLNLCMEWVDKMIDGDKGWHTFYKTEGEKNRYILKHYSSSININTWQFILMRDYQYLAIPYFSNCFALNAPDDWFDSC